LRKKTLFFKLNVYRFSFSAPLEERIVVPRGYVARRLLSDWNGMSPSMEGSNYSELKETKVRRIPSHSTIPTIEFIKFEGLNPIQKGHSRLVLRN
jgi:hypothetical protein